MKRVLALILAGGKGVRLEPLTRDRAKPAVPFGGVYRIIDFTLSNCVNSDIRRIFILTQYKSLELNRHIRDGWHFLSAEMGEFIEDGDSGAQLHLGSNRAKHTFLTGGVKWAGQMGGLVPEWGFVDGRTDGSSYGYNACRTPWRVAVDYFWYCTPEARTFLQGVSSYVDSNGGVSGVRFDKKARDVVRETP